MGPIFRRPLPDQASGGTAWGAGGLTLMKDDEVYDEPSAVKADEGQVAVKGPDQVDVKLTPEAAEETSDRLLEGAMVARGKRRMAKLPHRPN
jgi:hypothetical protein